MKLYINENFESTTSIGAEFNPQTDLLNVIPDVMQDLSQYSGAVPVADPYVSSPYENLEALGMLFTVASNDIHTIHVNACGKDFMRLHLDADELYKQLSEYADTCFEMCCEDGHFINSINDATEILKDRYTPVESGVSFELVEGVQKIIDILNFVVGSIAETYNEQISDVQSTLDEWSRYLSSKMNYFLARVLTNNIIANESIMARSSRPGKRRKGICEHLDHLKLGQSYTMFCQVEDHIDDYNCDLYNIKKGDYIIRDFQWGHLPNGGNKGYIPYEVTDIEYVDMPEGMGYNIESNDEKVQEDNYDRRVRIELNDGYETHYVVAQVGRANGMFHKLKKSSIQK